MRTRDIRWIIGLGAPIALLGGNALAQTEPGSVGAFDPPEPEAAPPTDPAPAHPQPAQPGWHPPPQHPPAPQPPPPVHYPPPTGPAPPPAQQRSGAGEPAPPPPPQEDGGRVVSLTMSPLHLILPLLELTLELSVAEHLGVAVLGGIGRMTVEVDGADERFSAYELGGQLLVYPLDAFDGLTLGAEVLWLRLTTDEVQGRISGTGAGLAVGPLIGYKWIARGGFTLFVHGGAQYLAVRAQSTDDLTGTQRRESERRWIPLLNFNLGWSF